MNRSFAPLATLLVALVGLALPAHAGTRTHTVKQSVDTLHVAMKPGRQVVLRFKAHIIDFDRTESGKITAKLRRRMNTVVLWAPKDTPPERVSGRLAIATARYMLLIDVSPAGAEADDAIEIDDAGLVELCSARDQRELETAVSDALAKQAAEFTRKMAEQAEQHVRELQRKDAQNARKTDQALLDQVTDRLQEIPLDSIPCAGDGLVMCEPKLMLIGDGAVLRMPSRNSSSHEAPIADVRVYNAEGENLVTGINIGREGDEPGDLDDPDWTHAAPDDPDRVLGVIPPGGTVITSVKLRNPERLGTSFKVVMAGVASVLPAIQPVHLMDRMQQEALERRERYLRDREAKRVSLHLVGSYGAIWLPADVGGSDDVAATSLAGLGVRVTKGMHPNLAVEVEFAGATSGTTTFRDVNGMGDDLTRSAKLARVQFGGVLRFGEDISFEQTCTVIAGVRDCGRYPTRVRRGSRIVPTLRFGLGLQLISRDATMTGGGSADVPEKGTEFTETAIFGAGVSFRLGAEWTASVGATVVTPRDDELFKRTIEAGLHLGYVWPP